MFSPDSSIRKHLKEIKRTLDSCGAGEAALVEPGALGRASGEEVHLLVRMAGDRSLLDIIPAEEELARLLERPVFIIPEQTLHPDQARRLRESARSI